MDKYCVVLEYLEDSYYGKTKTDIFGPFSIDDAINVAVELAKMKFVGYGYTLGELQELAIECRDTAVENKLIVDSEGDWKIEIKMIQPYDGYDQV